MRIPVWLTLGVAILVLLFGVHRIRLSFRSADDETAARQRKGLYAMSGRTHRLIGIIYVLLGAALVAASFGWSPFAGLFEGKPPAQKTMELQQKPVQPK